MAVMRVGAWLVLDAVLDNASAVALQSSGTVDLIARARTLRERGWTAGSIHPLHGRGPVGWPPADDWLDIRLDGADLMFLLARIEDAIDLANGLVATDQLDAQARGDQEQSLVGLESVRAQLTRWMER